MKVMEALAMAETRLGDRVEAECLLADVLLEDRVGIYLRRGETLRVGVARRFESMVEMRCAGIPLQYVTGVQSFYGLDLQVGPGVLVPRPETEQLVACALEVIANVDAPKVLDVATGSGAIALAIANERLDASVFASDISARALFWARRNGSGTDVQFLQGDLFESFSLDMLGGIDLVICNPPYLCEKEWREAPVEVRVHEPRLATVSGSQGSEVLCRVIIEAIRWLKPGGWLVLEITPARLKVVKARMSATFVNITARKDLAGMDRIVSGQKP